MSRYIDADVLRDKLYEADAVTMRGVAIINNEPTVDAVPVVRCCDCRWCDYPAPNSTKYGCRLFDRCVKGDWYCADGERRTDEQ